MEELKQRLLEFEGLLPTLQPADGSRLLSAAHSYSIIGTGGHMTAIRLKDFEALFKFIQSASNLEARAADPAAASQGSSASSAEEEFAFIAANYGGMLLARLRALASEVPKVLMALIGGQISKMAVLMIIHFSLCILHLLLLQAFFWRMFSSIQSGLQIFDLLSKEEVEGFILGVECFTRDFKDLFDLDSAPHAPKEADFDDRESWERQAQAPPEQPTPTHKKRNSIIKLPQPASIPEDTPLRKKRHGVLLKGVAFPNAMQADYKERLSQSKKASRKSVTSTFMMTKLNREQAQGRTLFTEAATDPGDAEPRLGRTEGSVTKYYCVKWVKRIGFFVMVFIVYQVFTLWFSVVQNSHLKTALGFMQNNLRLKANAHHIQALISGQILTGDATRGRLLPEAEAEIDLLGSLLTEQSDLISKLSATRALEPKRSPAENSTTNITALIPRMNISTGRIRSTEASESTSTAFPAQQSSSLAAGDREARSVAIMELRYNL